ncbi:MAG: Unknown protein [uncultured Sulfurovum sp.]|uniref:Tyr recombinase domain-containing protein n=1 Tax=uncultured Sulfurovum sp. TaxID=269237 RepID=A0A6S6UAF9_9BACT|nr:MAG: Unknown protein [uncultured Sulfurovum sp.]
MAEYLIKRILFSHGERLPMLIDTETGMPDYWATLFSISQYRSKAQASNTIEQVLRQLMLLNIFLKHYSKESINLDERIAQGKILHLHEIENLCDLCKLFLEDIHTDIHKKPLPQNIPQTSLEKFRTNNSKKQIRTVSSDTTANRIRVIRDFLVWRTNISLTKLQEEDLTFNRLKESRDLLKSNMTSRIPSPSGNSWINAPKGLSEEETSLLFEAVTRDSPTNPWKNEFTKTRNELLILWLYQFGLRKGELLSIKISDINFQSETFILERRADDSEDPRINQPLIKTFGRELPIPKKIIRLTKDYIINHRRHLPQAKKHEFLFVASKTGAPMSLDTVNKVFSKLKETYPGAFKKLSPHILRHSWNDNFSEKMDKEHRPEEEEKKIRSYAMGWSETSNSAENYTKRYIQKKANAVLRDMGNDLWDNDNIHDSDKEER